HGEGRGELGGGAGPGGDGGRRRASLSVLRVFPNCPAPGARLTSTSQIGPQPPGRNQHFHNRRRFAMAEMTRRRTSLLEEAPVGTEQQEERKVIFASSLGTVFEWY